MHPPSSAFRASIRRRLRVWFARHARALPWRRSRDPYRIWISEVMLQQTQVATVIPYYARFLKALPTLRTLARAEEQSVLRLWEGLGYYRRARALSQAAQQLVQLHHRTIPDDPELLRTLPGFGRYTVNAVLSQAYDRRVPIVEANSRRVLCRLFGIADDPTRPAVDQLLWRLAESLLPKKRVGDFNQALMELGALVCVSTMPRCGECPLRRQCTAHLQNRQHEIPHRARRADIIAIDEIALVLRKGDAILLVQRPHEGRWARMWEMPHEPLLKGETHLAAVQRLLTSLGLAGDVMREIVTVRHNVTRFNITMVCYEVAYRGGTHSGAVWVRPDELGDYPLSTPQRRLAKQIALAAPSPPVLRGRGPG